LLDKATAWLNVKNDENARMNAYSIYNILNMPEKQKKWTRNASKHFLKERQPEINSG
jgi:hypothetical protein